MAPRRTAARWPRGRRPGPCGTWRVGGCQCTSQLASLNCPGRPRAGPEGRLQALEGVLEVHAAAEHRDSLRETVPAWQQLRVRGSPPGVTPAGATSAQAQWAQPELECNFEPERGVTGLYYTRGHGGSLGGSTLRLLDPLPREGASVRALGYRQLSGHRAEAEHS